MNKIIFDRPYLFLLLIPLCLLIVLPFIFAFRHKKVTFHEIVSLVLHFVVCTLLITSLSGLSHVYSSDTTSLYFLADVSNTTQDVQIQMDSYIKEFSKKKDDTTHVGVIAFGRNQQEIVPLNGNLVSVSKNNVDKSATDIEKAIEYAKNRFDEDSKKRIIILSDGKETDGNSLKESQNCISENIKIDAVFFNSDLSSDVYEVSIDSVSMNDSTFMYVDEIADVKIKSNQNEDASIKVFLNNQLVSEENVTLAKGTNVFSYYIPTIQAGKFEYKFLVEAEKDRNPNNNSVLKTIEVVDKSNVLLISSDYKNSYSIQESLTDFCNLNVIYPTTYFEPTLDNLCKYDEIILGNLDLTKFTNASTLSNNIKDFVMIKGKSLITIGGDKTYQDGGFSQYGIDEILPVDCNPESTRDATALMLVIDNSGSMSGASIESAKAGAIQCLDLLEPTDYVGVITFGDTTQVIQPLSKIGAYKKRIIDRINSIKTGDGTIMTPALSLASQQLKKVDLASKEMIILSDGMPYDNGQEDVVRDMAANNIVTSTINIGNYSGGSLMKSLATIGGGRYYYTSSNASIEDLMLDEVTKLVMDTTLEGTIQVNTIDSFILDSVKQIPTFNTINFSNKKFNATNMLTCNVTTSDAVTYEDLPLYTYWDYGEGKVASFMSSLDNSWTTTWDANSLKAFLENIVYMNLPTKHIDTALDIDVESNGYTSKLNIKVNTIQANTEMKAKVTTPSGKTQDINLYLNNGVYTSDFISDEIGKYEIDISYIKNQTYFITTYKKEYNFSYSSEYKEFELSDNSLLWKLVGENGKVSNNVDDLVLVDNNVQVVRKSYDSYLLITSLIIFVVDIFIRKIKWKDIKNIFSKKGTYSK